MEPYPVAPDPRGEWTVPPPQPLWQLTQPPAMQPTPMQTPHMTQPPMVVPAVARVPAVLVVGWLLAAAVALVAPFLRVESQTIAGAGDRFDTSVTGWGAIDGALSRASSAHAMRWGVVLSLAAIALVVGAVGARARRRARWPAVLAAVGCLVLAAAGLCMALAIDAALSSQYTRGEVQYRIDIGPGAWLTVAAGALAVALALWSLIIATGGGRHVDAMGDTGWWTPDVRGVTP